MDKILGEILSHGDDEALRDMTQFLVSMQEIEKITLNEVLIRLLEADIAAYNLEGGIV